MSAREKFQEILNFLEQPIEHNVTIALATYIEDELPQYRSLNISVDVAASFTSVAKKFFSRFNFLEESGDLVLHEYSAEYKPDRHEVEYIQIENSILQPILTLMPAGSEIPLLDSEEDFVDNLRFYMLIFEHNNNRIAMLRRSNRNKELTRSKNLILRLMGERFEKLTETTFQFDNHFDAILFGNYIFSFNKSNFQHIFRFYELLQAAAEQSLETIRANIPIANFEDFKQSCLSHLQKLEKLRNIAAKPYISSITMPTIKRTIEEFNLDVQTSVQNGEEKLIFDNSNKWGILNLLDDAYLGSQMTGYKYEVNSKREI